MSRPAECGHDLIWHGCYSGAFDLIAPESFAHPAKMSPALCFKILDHLAELGLLKDTDTVLDPMAGTGLVNICAGAKGLKSISFELEEKFIAFEKTNREYASRKLHKELAWEIIQGDARKLSELLTERGMVTCTSPPYQDVNQDNRKTWNDTVPLRTITSPPYEDMQFGQDKEFYQKKCLQTGRSTDSAHQKQYGQEFYGSMQNQIGQEKGDSYLSAMRRVYAEIAKVSDVLAIVLKNPTRAGKLRRLDSDTVAVLESCGWRIHCRHRAMLFEEHETTDLFGETTKKVKGRMSFFKRLSWQKGQPVAAWEDVLIAVR